MENVACLPGIVKASFAMPDVHWGYGFPIGGVAATDVEHGGVVSPGGVGFDISCGIRLLSTTFDEGDIQPRLTRLMTTLKRDVSQVGVSRACRERGMKDSRNNRGGCRGDPRFLISDCFVN